MGTRRGFAVPPPVANEHARAAWPWRSSRASRAAAACERGMSWEDRAGPDSERERRRRRRRRVGRHLSARGGTMRWRALFSELQAASRAVSRSRTALLFSAHDSGMSDATRLIVFVRRQLGGRLPSAACFGWRDRSRYRRLRVFRLGCRRSRALLAEGSTRDGLHQHAVPLVLSRCRSQRSRRKRASTSFAGSISPRSASAILSSNSAS